MTKVEEAQQALEYAALNNSGAEPSKSVYERAVDNLIAAVRAEQQCTVCSGPPNRLGVYCDDDLFHGAEQQPEEESHLCPDRCHHATCKKAEQQPRGCLHDGCSGVAQWCDKCANEPEIQPRGHVANCVCNLGCNTSGHCEPKPDPRCKPGLLHGAEHDCDLLDEVIQNWRVGDLDDFGSWVRTRSTKARAEVEQIRARMKGEK